MLFLKSKLKIEDTKKWSLEIEIIAQNKNRLELVLGFIKIALNYLRKKRQ